MSGRGPQFLDQYLQLKSLWSGEAICSRVTGLSTLVLHINVPQVEARALTSVVLNLTGKCAGIDGWHAVIKIADFWRIKMLEAQHLVSYILLSAWFVWCLVFVSRMGQWHTRYHTQLVCQSGPQGMPLRGLWYPPHSPYSPGCMHKWALVLCM